MILKKIDVPESVPANIREQLRLLTGEVQDLVTDWQIFEQISAQENMSLMNNTAPEFFRRIQEVLFEHLIIGIARLSETPQQGGKQNLTFDHLFFDKPAELDKLIEFVGKAPNIRRIRNKLVAHLDFACGLDSNDLTDNKTLTEIKESIELMEAIIERAWLKWTKGSFVVTHPGPEIFNCLQKAVVYDVLEVKGKVPPNFWNWPDDMRLDFFGTGGS
jgi:hypothetical protein